MEQPDPSPANSLSASTPAKPAKRSKTVPVPIVVGVICLGLGMAGGIVLGEYMGDRGKKYTDGGPQGTDSQAQADVMMKAKGGRGKGGGKGGKGGGKGGAPAGPKGGGGPSSKAQLAQLVAKLDTLTAKPLTIQLSSEQKKQVHAVLTEIGMLGEMNDDDAKVKLDTLLRLLEDQKETFVAAGFAWPGYREPGRPPQRHCKTPIFFE